MGNFFSSERLVVAPDNKTLRMEREGDSSSRKGRMQYVVETISVLHSTAQHSTAQLSTNEKSENHKKRHGSQHENFNS